MLAMIGLVFGTVFGSTIGSLVLGQFWGMQMFGLVFVAFGLVLGTVFGAVFGVRDVWVSSVLGGVWAVRCCVLVFWVVFGAGLCCAWVGVVDGVWGCVWGCVWVGWCLVVFDCVWSSVFGVVGR